MFPETAKERTKHWLGYGCEFFVGEPSKGFVLKIFDKKRRVHSKLKLDEEGLKFLQERIVMCLNGEEGA